MNPRVLLDDVDLRGERVRLRRPRLEEAPRSFELIAGRREILDWIEWSGPSGVEEMRDKARNWRVQGEDGANYQLAIARPEDDLLVGALSLRFVDHPECGDLGYWIGAQYQGRGLASEAVGLAVWLAFEVLAASRVSACVFEGNTASRRVLEKHGFELKQASPCETSCEQRPRWSFALERSAWLSRAAAQRPLDFALAFSGDLP